MATLLVSQPNFASHATPTGHPERPDRIRAVEEALSADRFDRLIRREAPSADLTLAELVHDANYLGILTRARPAEGIGQIDEDTFISSHSLEAAATALGGGLAALEAVALGEVRNAFCAVRPPGHHAEIDRPMGFCLINSIAVVAREAQRKFGAERVAIVDFDVHHGNGTEDIFKDDPTVFYASSHQMPLYPGTGAPSFTGVGNICNAALAAGSGDDDLQLALGLGILLQPGGVEGEAGGVDAEALPGLHLALVGLLRDLAVELERLQRMDRIGREADLVVCISLWASVEIRSMLLSKA